MGRPVCGLAPFRGDSHVHGIVSRGDQRSDLDPVVLGWGQGGLQNAVRGRACRNIPDITALEKRMERWQSVQTFFFFITIEMCSPATHRLLFSVIAELVQQLDVLGHERCLPRHRPAAGPLLHFYLLWRRWLNCSANHRS